MGFRHIVVSLTTEGELGATLRSMGVEVVALRMSRNCPSPRAIVRLTRIVQREQPVVVRTSLYHANLIGLIAVRMANAHAVAWNLRCSNMDLSQYRWTTRAVVKLLIWRSSRPDLVITNSEAGRRWHSTLGYRPKRWKTIPNGIDTAKFRPDPDARARWRRRLGVNEDEILIGMVARRDPTKNHEGMLRAATELVRRRSRLVFIFAGRDVSRADPTLARLADQVRAPVHLIDECDDVPGLNSALDVAVLASTSEGFPNVVAEAMAVGVPCVVTDAGDSAAIVDGSGLIVPIPERWRKQYRRWRKTVHYGREWAKRHAIGSNSITASPARLPGTKLHGLRLPAWLPRTCGPHQRRWSMSARARHRKTNTNSAR